MAFKMKGPSLYKKMYSESPMKKYKCKTPKKMMGKAGCSICAYGKRKCTCR